MAASFEGVYKDDEGLAKDPSSRSAEIIKSSIDVEGIDVPKSRISLLFIRLQTLVSAACAACIPSRHCLRNGWFGSQSRTEEGSPLSSISPVIGDSSHEINIGNNTITVRQTQDQSLLSSFLHLKYHFLLIY